MITVYDKIPPMVVVEGDITRLFFDFKEVEIIDSESTSTKYQGQNVDIKGAFEYGTIISAIIKDKYTSDERDAVLANYELAKEQEYPISEEKRSEYIREYSEYQRYRIYAKEIANQVLSYGGGAE